jgi:hypothetical protein
MPFQSLWSAISSAYAGWTARERMLVVGFGLVLLLLAPIKAYDLARDLQDRQFETQLSLREAQVRSQSGVGNVGSSLKGRREAVSKGLRTVRSVAVGKVLLVQQVTELAVNAGVTGVDVSVGDVTDTVGVMTVIRIQLNGNFSWPSFTKLLTTTASSKQKIIISSISINKEQSNRLRLAFDVPVIIGTPSQ